MSPIETSSGLEIAGIEDHLGNEIDEIQSATGQTIYQSAVLWMMESAIDSGNVAGGKLWRLHDPSSPGNAVYYQRVGHIFDVFTGLAYLDEKLYTIQNATPDQLHEASFTNTNQTINRGSFPSQFNLGVGGSYGMTSSSTALWISVTQSSGTNSLWELSNLSDPSSAVNRGSLPSGVGRRLAYDGSSLWASKTETSRSSLWELSDLSDPSSAVNRGSLPSGVYVQEMEFHRGSLWIMNQTSFSGYFTYNLWELSDLSDPSSAVNRGSLPSGYDSYHLGMTSF